MAGRALDRRIQKTLQLLQNALAELIAEKAYDDVTIQEILDRANVGRSTFYAHFENKDQLLRSLLEQVRERYGEGIQQVSHAGTTWDDNSANMPFHVLRLVEQNHRLFRAMLVQQEPNARANPFRDYLLALTREHFRQMLGGEQPDARALELAAQFYASAFVGALAWWLENDMVYPAEALGRLLNRLTLPGLREAFGGQFGAWPSA